MLSAMLPQTHAAITILDELSLAGDFDGDVGDNLGGGGTFSGGWVNSGSRNLGYSSTAAAGRPAGASNQYLRQMDHRRRMSLDLGYTTSATDEQYNISFYTFAATNNIEFASDFGQLTLYYTSDNQRTGSRVDSIVLQGFTSDGVWSQTAVSGASFTTDPGAGRNLFLDYRKNSTVNNANDEFIGVDNISVELVTPIPEPNSIALGALSGLMLLLRRRRR